MLDNRRVTSLSLSLSSPLLSLQPASNLLTMTTDPIRNTVKLPPTESRLLLPSHELGEHYWFAVALRALSRGKVTTFKSLHSTGLLRNLIGLYISALNILNMEGTNPRFQHTSWWYPMISLFLNWRDMDLLDGPLSG